jgi:hypothetical protein
VSDIVDAAYRAGWLAFAAKAGEILDGLLADSRTPPGEDSAAMRAFVVGRETAWLIAGCRIAEAAGKEYLEEGVPLT